MACKLAKFHSRCHACAELIPLISLISVIVCCSYRFRTYWVRFYGCFMIFELIRVCEAVVTGVKVILCQNFAGFREITWFLDDEKRIFRSSDVVLSEMSVSALPLFVSGVVTRGFGRGSKELGCPTANYSQDVVKSLPHDLDTGIYCGFASVDHGAVHKMVMSVGWNPFYNGKEKTMEIHILHEYDDQFYGSQMRVCVLKYLRPERNFNSVEELIAQIQDDIAQAKVALDDPSLNEYQSHKYFNERDT